jgi:CHAT domain-containing protein
VLPRLGATAREAAAIASLAPDGDGIEAVGFAATREAVLSPDLRQFRYLHFATHARVDAQRPELSGIVLSQVDEQGTPRNGVVRLGDLVDLHLRADLVVLSACQTALGPEMRGEGLLSLTRGFMAAGVPRVVASLWQVPDRATAELMRHFYAALVRDKLPAPEALRRSQLAVRADRRWRHPYYWAGFALSGEWR